MSYLAVAVVLLAVLCGLNLAMTLAVVRRLRRQAERATEDAVRLPPGVPVPEFSAVTVAGRVVARSDLTGARAMVAFLAANCPPCHEQVPAFVAYARSVPGGAAQVLAVVVGGTDAETAELARDLEGTAEVVLEPVAGPLQKAFSVTGFPTFYVLDETGRIQVSAPVMRAVPAFQAA